MVKYSVTIVRQYITEILVDAENAEDAKRQIEKYGILEACSDYPNSGDTMTIEKIKTVKRASK